MGHFIQCVIGKTEAINDLSSRWIRNSLELNHGFSLFPITDDLKEDMDELADEGAQLVHQHFDKLNKSVERVLKDASYVHPIGYFETEYHGGQGAQMAIAYYKGNIIVEPSITITEWDNKQLKFTDNPPGVSSINKMLYEIGLKERSDKDGFDDLGLGNYRSNESILNNIL